jgi:uncharacterized protein
MGPIFSKSSLTLFGKVRSSLLALLFCNSERAFYFREITRLIGMGRGGIQRELGNLLEAELIVSYRQGNQVYYRANRECPIFPEIKSMMTKTLGVAGILQESLKVLEDHIVTAFIFGSFAKGREKPDSDVDVFVIGDTNFSEVSNTLGSVQETVGREINPSVYPVNEFLAKVSERHHFVTSLINEPKIFLVGDEDDFAKLVEKRLAD